MSVIQSFIAKGPGYYTLEASLLFKPPTPNSEWEVIDVKKSFFAVSKEWRNKIDG
jgi:hypothetical protein